MSILFFTLKPLVKKLLSIEIVIFHTSAFSEKYQSQKVVSNKLEKGPLIDYATAFCTLLPLMALEKKIFKDQANFGSFSLPVQKFRNHLNKFFRRTTQGTLLQNISFLGVIFSESFKEMLTHSRNTYERQ
jgi:hypothetical protein